MMRRVAVFCGSARGARSEYEEAARALGRVFAARGIGLVYGGSRVGLMGILADTLLEAGAEIIGVIPQDLVDREVAHNGLRDLRVVGSMHERKALMADMADGFIAMPGGFGTLDEFCEVVTWAQLGIHSKPCGVLNVAGYYDDLLAMFDHSCREGFVKPAHREMVVSHCDAGKLLDLMEGVRIPRLEKWPER